MMSICASLESKVQRFREAADSRACGHVGFFFGGVLMSFVVVVGIVAVAAPYWTASMEAQGITTVSSATLWSRKSTQEANGASVEQEMGMCSDEMQQDTIDCDKLFALRFFAIMLICTGAATSAVWLVAFSPNRPGLRQVLGIVGSCLSAFAFFCNYMAVCLAASAGVHTFSLNGSGFVFLCMSLLLTFVGVVLALFLVTRWLPKLQLPMTMIGSRATALLETMQVRADARGCGPISFAVAGVLMLVAACPMSVVAVAAEYWTASVEAGEVTTHISASLWSVATSVEMNGESNTKEVSMCGDGMLEGTYACGKIHATRFFVIILLLLAATAASLWLLAFAPARSDLPASVCSELRAKLCHTAVLFTGGSFFWNFLVMCIAASIQVPAPMRQNGAGFAFVAMTFLLLSCATTLALFAGTEYPQGVAVPEAPKAATSDVEICESAEKATCVVQPIDQNSMGGDCAINGLSKGENPTLLESRPVSSLDVKQGAHAKESESRQASLGPRVKESSMEPVPPCDPEPVSNDTYMAAEERPYVSAKPTPAFWCCGV